MIEQLTEEWFKARVGLITGSRAGALLGLSPFQSKDDVIRSMVREYHGADTEFNGNIATSFGNKFEQTAVSFFELEKDVDVSPAGFCIKEGDVFGASPDGFVSDGRGLEVKVPYAGIKKTLSEQPHYYAQIQLCMYCSGLKEWHFWQFDPRASQGQHEIVKWDPNWADHALPELRQAHAFYLSELDNPDHLAPLRIEINTQEACLLVAEMDEMKDARDRADERMKEIVERLVDMTGGKDALVDGRLLTKVQKAGAVSYAKALKAIAPKADLEPYRGAATSYWKIT